MSPSESAKEQAATAEPAAARFRTQPGDHRFFSTLSVLIALVVLTGFSRTYLPKAFGAAPVPTILHVHAALFSGWLVLFVLQTTLVLRGSVKTHRRLGVASCLYALLMLIVGALTAMSVARAGHRGVVGVELPSPAAFLLLNLVSIVVFDLFIAAGWFFRRSPQAHKRVMLLATISLMPPGLARLVGGHPPVIAAMLLAFLLAGPIYDLVTRKRPHRAYLIGVPLILLWGPPLVIPLAATAGWQSIAAALIGSP
jgi:hypothetical protein